MSEEDIDGRLNDLCQILGWEFLSHQREVEHWVLRGTGGPDVDVQKEGERLLLSSQTALPQSVPAGAPEQGGSDAYHAALTRAATGVDPMLRPRIDSGLETIQLQLPIYLDGLSAQELARSQAALSLAVDRIQEASEAYLFLDEQSRHLEETLSDISREAEGLAELGADLDALNEKLAPSTTWDEEDDAEDEDAGEEPRSCAGCGRPLPEGKQFCTGCGARVGD